MLDKFQIKTRSNLDMQLQFETTISPIGLVVVMHGLGGNKDNSQNTSFRKILLSHNYAVVSFDCIHTFHKSGGNYENATATSYLEDLEDAIAFIKKQPWYQEPFVLVGHSLGSLAIFIWAHRNQNKVKGIAPLCTVVNLETTLSALPKDLQAEWIKTGWAILEPPHNNIVKKLRWPEFLEDLKQYDLIKVAPEMKIPILLMVGSNDRTTPIDTQEKLFKALSTKKELHIINGATHRFKNSDFEQITPIFSRWLINLE